MSVAADYYFPWIPRDKSHRNCFQLLEWDIEGRYWFGEDRTYEDRLEGHSAGLSLAAGYYDFVGKDKVSAGKQFVQYVATSTNSLLAEPAYKNWTGQVFKYWHTHPKGDNSRGRRYDNGDIMNLSQDITLYAIW
mgnify:CR=1 FL=1